MQRTVSAQSSMQNTSGKIVWVRDEDIDEFLYGESLQEATSLERQMLLGELEDGPLMGSERFHHAPPDSVYPGDLSLAVDWPSTNEESRRRHPTTRSSSPEPPPLVSTSASSPHAHDAAPADVQMFRLEYGQRFTDRMSFVPTVNEYERCWLPGGVDITGSWRKSTTDNHRTSWSTLTRTDGFSREAIELNFFERSTGLSIRDAFGFDYFGFDATRHFVYISSPKRACFESDVENFAASFVPCLVDHPSVYLEQDQISVEPFYDAANFDFNPPNEASTHTSIFASFETMQRQPRSQSTSGWAPSDQEAGASNADSRYNPVCKQRLQKHKDYNGEGTFDPRAVDPVTLDPLVAPTDRDDRPLKRKERPDEDTPEAGPSEAKKPHADVKKTTRHKPKTRDQSPSPGSVGWTCLWPGCGMVRQATAKVVRVHIHGHVRGLPNQPMICPWPNCWDMLNPKSLPTHFVRKHHQSLKLISDEFACGGACGDPKCEKTWMSGSERAGHLSSALKKKERVQGHAPLSGD